MSRPRFFAIRIAAASAIAAAGLVALAGTAGAEPGFSQLQVMPKPVGTPASGAAYSAISCPSTTVCTAVGPGGSGGLPSAVDQTSGAWGTPVELVPPFGAVTSGAQSPGMFGISCSAVGDCVAVGVYGTSGGSAVPLAFTESSGTWGADEAIPLPAEAASGAAEHAEATDVDCPTTGNCVVIGVYEGTDNLLHQFADTQASGGAFTAAALPDILGNSSSTLAVIDSLSCTDTSNCTAIGEQLGATSVSSPTWTETAGSWGSPGQIPLAGDSQFLGLSISCPDATTCLAVGAYLNAATGEQEAGVATETSGVWGNASDVANPSLSPLTFVGSFNGVSCADDVCEAVGEFSGLKDISAAGAATWSSGTWSTVGLARGVPAGTERANISLFSAVSCASGTACTAVGGAGRLLNVRNFPAEHAFSAGLTPVRTVTSPSSPTLVKGTSLIGGVKVAWQPPVDDGGAPVHTYQATASPGGATCRTAGTHCALHGLRNGHRYRIVVTDTTSYGRSHTSSASIVLVGAKPSTPPALRVTTRSGHLVASWHGARTPAGEPVRYLVKVRGPHHFSRNVVTRGHELVVAVSATGAYAVSVTAINASGSSKPAVARHTV